MKKFLSILTAALMAASMAVSVCAADAPNGYIKMNVADAEIIDDATTQDKGGNGTFISVIANYGVGNSSLNDAVGFKADFGANGASAINILFGYGKNDGSKTKLNILVDDLKSTPVATVEIGYTGGWDIKNAQWINVPVTIPAGEHTVYVQFANEMSGSFSDVVFEEAAPAVVAPATFDAGVITAVVALVSGAGVVVAKKKH